MSDPDQPPFRIGDDGEIEDNLPLPEYKPKKKVRSRLVRGTRRLFTLTFWIVIIGLSGLGGATAIHFLRTNGTQPTANIPNCVYPIHINGTAENLLVYMTEYNGTNLLDHVYITNFDGSERKFLTDRLPSGSTLSLSPDGKHLITSRFVNGVSYLFLIETDTLTERRLREGHYPGWASDSKRIAFLGGTVLYTLDIKSDELTTIMESVSILSPKPIVWSPDDKYLAFTVSHNGKNDILIVDVARKTRRVLGNTDKTIIAPVWSPDGKYIAYSSTSDIYAVSTDGSTSLNVTKGTRQNPVGHVWSADSKRLAFVDIDNNGIGPYSVFIANLDGSGSRRLFTACELMGY